jgi:hypothetical protein
MNTSIEFKLDVINKLEQLYNYGLRIDNTTYTINKVITIYVKTMKLKFKNLGSTYINNMVKHIEIIINNITKDSQYDTIEFVNSILNYCINTLYFYNNKIDREPQLPDYTIDEIKDMANNL